MRKTIKLPENEFEILKDQGSGEAQHLVLYDKVVDRCYTRKDGAWFFPKGSRVEIILKLMGVEF